MDHKNYR